MIRYLGIPDAFSSLRVDEKNLGRETLSPALFRAMAKLAILLPDATGHLEEALILRFMLDPRCCHWGFQCKTSLSIKSPTP